MDDLIERLEEAWRLLYGDGDEHGVCEVIAEAQAALRAVREADDLPTTAAQGFDAGLMQDIADAAAALDKRGDRQMATRMMRRHEALAAAAKGVGGGG